VSKDGGYLSGAAYSEHSVGCNGKKFNDIETRLYKLIADNEKKEGFDGKMDRKSLRRILSNLAESGFIKNIRIKLKLGQKTKELLFICDPNIDESHTIIQSAVEQVPVKVLKTDAKPNEALICLALDVKPT